jgi:O-antigen ligase
MLGFSAGLLLQAFVGFMEFSTQSTIFLKPLNLHWPGLIDTASQGASILKPANGENFLRVYGTFPHPNILAGFILMGIASATSFILSKNRINWFPVIVLAIASALLAVTFSRSAWLGLGAFFIVIFLKSRSLNIKKLWFVFSVTIITFVSTMFPLKELFLSRTTIPTSGTEDFSLVGRMWLAQQAFEFIKEKPLTGIGLGAFVIHLAERSGEFNYVEPVHNIPLLVISELGLIGFILLIAILITIFREMILTKKAKVILLGALLAGLGTIALLDHYLWSLAPGRMMLGISIGLWLGQVEKHDE